MAAYYRGGAETRDQSFVGIETTGGSGASVDTTIFRTGSASWKHDSTGGGFAAQQSTVTNQMGSFTPSSVLFYRVYFYFEQLPDSTVTILMPNGQNGCRVRLTSGGKLQLWNASAQVGSDSAATITTGAWYRVELKIDGTPASGSRTAEARLDGVTVANMTNGTFNANPAAVYGWIDGPGTNRVLYVDDVGCNDDSGSVNNSWLGDGRVVLLVPISDNARATLWTGGAGGTTNLYDAVNNTPPAGLATETNTSQIEHAGGAAGTTDSYDANMTSYSAAGITSADTIEVIFFAAIHGEDITTGTKLLNFEVLSNPAISSPGNATAGDNVGALGDYPTNWSSNSTNSRNKIEAPSVTLGTSPVMRARRPETASRVASVCAMYMIVGYTIGTPTVLPIISQPLSHTFQKAAIGY